MEDYTENVTYATKTVSTHVMQQRNGSSVPMQGIQNITEYEWYTAGYNVAIYGLPVVITVGLIGNTLSLLVATRPHNRRLPFGIYVAALAVADNIMLLGSQLQIWSMYYFIPERMSEQQCWGIIYITGVVGNFEAWTIAALALERYLCVCCPASSKKYRTTQVTAFILTGIVLVCLLKNTHIFFTTDFQYEQYTEVVVCVTGYYNGGSKVIALEVFEILFNSVIPFAFILYFNAKIVYRLRVQERYLQTIRSGPFAQDGRRNRSDSEESLVRSNGITVILIVVALTFILLTSPIFIFRAAFDYEAKSTPQEQAKYIFFNSVFSLVFATNFAVNFYLYCLTGSSFRKDLKRLFCECKFADILRRKSSNASDRVGEQ